MAIMDFVAQHILLVTIIIVILFFIVRYLYNSGRFKNFSIGLVKEETIEVKNETLQEKQDKVKRLNEELKIKILEDKINKFEKTEKKSSGFFDTNVIGDIGGSDDFFNTNVKDDILKGGKI